MITAYFLHIYDHSHDLSIHSVYIVPLRCVNITIVVEEIKQLNPDTIVCDCMTEFDADHVFKTFFELINDWLIDNNKVVTVLVPPFKPNVVSTHPQTVFEPTSGFYSIGICTVKQVMQDKQDEYSHPSKLFTCYNNNPKVERAILVDQLAKNFLFQHGITTFLNPDKVHDSDFKWQYHDGSILDAEDNFSPNPDSVMLLPDSYYKGFLDIVTESNYRVDEFFMTEKTMKPVGALKPFIALSSPGYNTDFLVNEFGFELYTELFDYSFDTMLDVNDRIQGIIDNLNRLVVELPISQYEDVYKSLLPKLTRNRERFLKYGFNKEKMIPKSLKLLTDPTVNYRLYSANTTDIPILNWMRLQEWIIQ